MRIGIVQSSPVFGAIERNIADGLDLMSSQSADLWVLPELFASGYQFKGAEEARALAEPIPAGPTSQALIEYASRTKSYIVAGLPELDGDAVYNASVLVGPEGYIARYRKVHLFYEEKLNFSPGNLPFGIVDIGIAKIGMMICFDHLFPESARSLALQGADIICHPANLVLPDLAQRTMAIRALENGVFTATANRIGTEHRGTEALTYTGQSQIIAPDGVVLCRLSEDSIGVHVLEIDVVRARKKSITKHNDKFGDRRPGLYRL